MIDQNSYIAEHESWLAERNQNGPGVTSFYVNVPFYELYGPYYIVATTSRITGAMHAMGVLSARHVWQFACGLLSDPYDVDPLYITPVNIGHMNWEQPLYRSKL